MHQPDKEVNRKREDARKGEEKNKGKNRKTLRGRERQF